MDEQTFQKELAADPGDDTPRLVYADWLSERGDPRGDFIRVQCRLARMEDSDAGRIELEYIERKLLAEFLSKWTASLRDLTRGESCEFRRGFLHQLALPATAFVERWREIFESAPLEHIHLLHPKQAWGNLLVCDGLSRLRGLDMRDGQLGIERLRGLLEQVDLSNLKSLGLGFNALSRSAMPLITRCPHLDSLQHLELDQLPLDRDGMSLLATSQMSRSLTSLSLVACELEDALLHAMSHGDVLPRLQRLDLSFNQLLTSDSIQRFIGSPRFDRLHAVSFRGCDLQASDVSFLARLRKPMALRRLNLEGTAFSTSVAKSLGRSQCLQGLVELSLSHCKFNDEWLEAMLSQAASGALRSLDLSRNDLGGSAVETIASWAGASTLTKLNLCGNRVGDRGLAVVAASTALRNLNALDLRDNNIGDLGIEAVLKSSNFQRITSLRLSDPSSGLGPKIRPQLKAAIEKRFGRHACIFA